LTTPNLSLDELVAAQSEPEVPINATFRALDALVQVSVLDITNTPPGTPADGDRHIVDTAPTGAFSGHAAVIAYWVAGSFNEWRFQTPPPGCLAYNVALDKFYYYKASTTSWIVTGII
jgi:hypothetical protein